MTERDYNMTGILGRNERREKDTHPTHSGQCTIDGKQYWISAWVNEGQKGKYFKLNFKAKMAREHQGGSKNPPAQQAKPQSDFDDEPSF